MTAPVSRIANGDSQSYWNAARDGRLELQACPDCGHVQFPPRVQCANCWSENIGPKEASGRGTIEGLTVVRRAPLKEFREKVPYVIVAVKTAEGPRIVSNLLGEGALDAKIGDAVEVCFAENAEGDALPQFRLA